MPDPLYPIQDLLNQEYEYLRGQSPEALQKMLEEDTARRKRDAELRDRLQAALSTSIPQLVQDRMQERLGWKGKSVPQKALTAGNWASAVLRGIFGLDPMAYRSAQERSIIRQFETMRPALESQLSDVRIRDVELSRRSAAVQKILNEERNQVRKLIAELQRAGVTAGERAQRLLNEATRLEQQGKLTDAKEKLMEAQAEYYRSRGRLSDVQAENMGNLNEWTLSLRALRGDEEAQRLLAMKKTTDALARNSRYFFAQNTQWTVDEKGNPVQVKTVTPVPSFNPQIPAMIGDIIRRSGRTPAGIPAPEQGDRQSAVQPPPRPTISPQSAVPEAAAKPGAAGPSEPKLFGVPENARVIGSSPFTAHSVQDIQHLRSAKNMANVALARISTMARNPEMKNFVGPIGDLKARAAQYMPPDMAAKLFQGLSDNQVVSSLNNYQQLRTALSLNVLNHAQGVGVRQLALIRQFQEKMASTKNSFEAIAHAVGAYNATITLSLINKSLPQYKHLLKDSEAIQRIGDYYMIQTERALAGLPTQDLDAGDAIQLIRKPQEEWRKMAGLLQSQLPPERRVKINSGFVQAPKTQETTIQKKIPSQPQGEVPRLRGDQLTEFLKRN